jgi:hypothetical protein
MTEWPDGGRTNEAEMAMYCPTHHRFIHRNKIRIVGMPGGELRHYRPDGSEVIAGPPALTPEIKEWLSERVLKPTLDARDKEPAAVGACWDTS